MNTDNRTPDRRYEKLYTELLSRGDQLHESNKRRIRRGIIFLVVLPIALEFIRWITDSDKVVFLIIWIFIMFAASAYLISIEYLDSAIEKTLQDVTDTEAGFDDLLPRPELPRADLHERILDRLAALRPEWYAAAENDSDEDEDEYEDASDSEAGAAITSEDEKESGSDAGIAIAAQGGHDAGAELREAEEAMKELKETAPADIIAAMKEAFEADEDLNPELSAKHAAHEHGIDDVKISSGEPEARHARKEDVV